MFGLDQKKSVENSGKNKQNKQQTNLGKMVLTPLPLCTHMAPTCKMCEELVSGVNHTSKWFFMYVNRENHQFAGETQACMYIPRGVSPLHMCVLTPVYNI